MDVPVNHFKRAIKEGQSQIGFWCSLASHVSVEILAGSGFDWLLLDSEHSPNETPQVYRRCHGNCGNLRNFSCRTRSLFVPHQENPSATANMKAITAKPNRRPAMPVEIP